MKPDLKLGDDILVSSDNENWEARIYVGYCNEDDMVQIMTYPQTSRNFYKYWKYTEQTIRDRKLNELLNGKNIC